MIRASEEALMKERAKTTAITKNDDYKSLNDQVYFILHFLINTQNIKKTSISGRIIKNIRKTIKIQSAELNKRNCYT